MNVTENNALEVATVTKRLLEIFDLGEVKFLPGSVSGNRAMALAYIDARHVMDRLDEVLGINGWKDEYSVLPGGHEVECRLSLKIGGEWVTKVDVGGMSGQPDAGDRMKAAYSDALKRAAVKFGVGRFLYRTGQAWHDYDPTKKKFAHPLKLVPKGDGFAVVVATAADVAAVNGQHKPAPSPATPAPLSAKQIAVDFDKADETRFLEIVDYLKDRELTTEERGIITPAFKRAEARLAKSILPRPAGVTR